LPFGPSRIARDWPTAIQNHPTSSGEMP
jgi:hypothetical protein